MLAHMHAAGYASTVITLLHAHYLCPQTKPQASRTKHAQESILHVLTAVKYVPISACEPALCAAETQEKPQTLYIHKYTRPRQGIRNESANMHYDARKVAYGVCVCCSMSSGDVAGQKASLAAKQAPA